MLLINLTKNALLNSAQKNTCDNENPVISRMMGTSVQKGHSLVVQYIKYAPGVKNGTKVRVWKYVKMSRYLVMYCLYFTFSA